MAKGEETTVWFEVKKQLLDPSLHMQSKGGKTIEESSIGKQEIV